MPFTDDWAPGPARQPRLGFDLQVWWIDVPCWRPHLARLRRLLSPDERARADRFWREPDADRLTIGRGILRMLIGGFLHVGPDQVVFAYSATGKPSVDGIEFNVAHSGDVVLIATHHRPVGVDVERIERNVDIPTMGPACFTLRERALIRKAAASREAFLRLWTRKEAWLKAVGTGLSFPLHDIDVADPAAPLIAPGAATGAALPSRIVDLPGDPGHLAACAIYGPDCRVHLSRLQEMW